MGRPRRCICALLCSFAVALRGPCFSFFKRSASAATWCCRAPVMYRLCAEGPLFRRVRALARSKFGALLSHGGCVLPRASCAVSQRARAFPRRCGLTLSSNVFFTAPGHGPGLLEGCGLSCWKGVRCWLRCNLRFAGSLLDSSLDVSSKLFEFSLHYALVSTLSCCISVSLKS